MRKKSSDEILTKEDEEKIERQSASADFLGTYVVIGYPLAVLIIWTIATLAGC